MYVYLPGWFDDATDIFQNAYLRLLRFALDQLGKNLFKCYFPLTSWIKLEVSLLVHTQLLLVDPVGEGKGKAQQFKYKIMGAEGNLQITCL